MPKHKRESLIYTVMMCFVMERSTARPSKASPEALEAMHRRNKDICCVFVFRAVILQKRN